MLPRAPDRVLFAMSRSEKNEAWLSPSTGVAGTDAGVCAPDDVESDKKLVKAVAYSSLMSMTIRRVMLVMTSSVKGGKANWP